MKTYISFITILMFLMSCKGQTKTNTSEAENLTETSYTSIGLKINDTHAVGVDQMSSYYEAMKLGDTLKTKMQAKVDAVCQAKGCWMTLSLEDGQQVMVKFKDYGFFMPKDIVGQAVIINGLAYVEEVSVEEQRHYAEDAGKSAEDIAAISSSKKTFAFEADGVLIKH
ncbi:DUF4920 domain-containing protein [Flavobacteriaceae bacterium LMO-SS05]